jgi:anaerobic dimethyl sulfoxide reductase subunit A
LQTPSGKIEIFSKQLHDLRRPDEIPPIPKYIQEWESPFPSNPSAPLEDLDGYVSDVEKYPLQAIGHHTLHRVHSTHDNNDWLGEAFPQRLFINPLDAAARGISDQDPVRVWNDRGELVIPARITPRILPGVVDLPQGAWWSPDEQGVDFGGCINVLTSERWTPFAFGSTQQTIMVQVARFQGKRRDHSSPASKASRGWKRAG